MNPQAPTATVPTPADQYAQLKSAVLGAQANTAPGASPLGDFPEIAKLYSSAPQVAKVDLASAGSQYNTGVTVANDAANAAAAAQSQKDLQDPSKYQQVQTPDGGYKFYDPTGKEISAAQFAAVHNTTPNEVLKHSQNSIAVAFHQDFDNLQTYMNAKLRSGSSQKEADIATGIEESVKQATNGKINLAKMSPQQLVAQFQAAYPTVYGGQGRGVSDKTTFIPNGNDIYNGQ